MRNEEAPPGFPKKREWYVPYVSTLLEYLARHWIVIMSSSFLSLSFRAKNYCDRLAMYVHIDEIPFTYLQYNYTQLTPRHHHSFIATLIVKNEESICCSSGRTLLLSMFCISCPPRHIIIVVIEKENSTSSKCDATK